MKIIKHKNIEYSNCILTLFIIKKRSKVFVYYSVTPSERASQFDLWETLTLEQYFPIHIFTPGIRQVGNWYHYI